MTLSASLLLSGPAAAALLLGASAAARSQEPLAGETAELPGGGSAAFRARMMDWSPTANRAPADRAPADELPAPAARAAAPSAAGTGWPHLSSRFGLRRDPFRGKTRLHAGIDMPGPLGTPIFASGPGIVSFAGTAGGYGSMIEIDHGSGYDTRYGHLSRILVRPGMAVAQGQLIGLMGSTGRSTGSHLHFEIRQGGRPTNPLPLLSGMPRPMPRHAPSGAPMGAPHPVVVEPAVPHISAFARRREAALSSAQDSLTSVGDRK